MKVKDVLIEAMRLAGREEVAEDAAGETPAAETVRIKRAFLTYLNAVLDELARGYFPLDTSEEMSSETGRYAFSDFLKCPIKINGVTDGKTEIEWRICPDYLQTDCKKITVEYEYAPPELTEEDDFFYPVFAVSKRLAEYGMVAENFLVAGDGAAYSAWENKYREEIENLSSRSKVDGRIPPRRWI